MRGIWILVGLLILGLPDSALADKRVALVIGNSSYLHAPVLANPRNDASDMAAKLKGLGFEVVIGEDLDLVGMRKAVRQFVDTLDGSDIALFFYAGHGLQVNGSNYMAPVDAQLASYDDLDFEALAMELVLSAMERNAKVNLVFLDACRDNPLAEKLAHSMGTRSSSVGRGLAKLETGIGSLIAFSTQPGNVARDGAGRNSPFTAALLKHVGTPGRSLTDELIDVRRAVLEATAGRQVPWDSSSLTGPVVLNPLPVPTTTTIPAGPADTSVEVAYWNTIKDSTERSFFEAYLSQYPNGSFAALATLKVEAIERMASKKSAASQGPVGKSKADDAGAEIAGLDSSPNTASEAPLGTPTKELEVLNTGDTPQIDFEKADRISTARGWELFLAKHQSDPLSARAREALALLRYNPADLVTPREAENRLNLSKAQRTEVQLALAGLGYEVGPTDGTFKADTRRAISAYQKAHRMAETGYVDRALANRLGLVGIPVTSSVSDSIAGRFEPDDLTGLETDERVIHAAQCLRHREIIYGEFQGHLYVAVYLRSISWSSAKMIAEACGAYLVTIGSKEENDFVYSLFSADYRMFYTGFDARSGYSFKSGPWIGLGQEPGRREPRDGWRWVNGEPMRYQNWARGHPSEHRSGDDYALYFADRPGKQDMAKVDARTWKDLGPSNNSSSFVLEFD